MDYDSSNDDAQLILAGAEGGFQIRGRLTAQWFNSTWGAEIFGRGFFTVYLKWPKSIANVLQRSILFT